MAEPTAQEQLMLELVNRARKNPQTEADLFGINLNEGLDSETINNSPKQPLAFNFILIDAARNHSQWMLDTDTFNHTGESGSNPGDRMEAAGYEFIENWSWGENIAWQGTTGTPNATEIIIEEHKNLFLSPSHRENLLNGDFREVGIGAILGEFDGWNALMTTQNFAKTGSSVFLTGVAFDDSVVEDNFYTVGEGIAGITVTAVRQSDNQTFSTTTMNAGGYQLALEPGTYNVTLTGEEETTTEVITIESENVKLDYIPTANSSSVVVIDLSGKSFNIVPDSLMVGDTFEVNFIVQNTAIGTAGDFEIDFYISQNNWISANDKFLGSYNINSLSSFSDTGTINQTFSLPDVNDSFWNNGDGTYYIGMLIDGEDEVFETTEENNQNQGQFLDYDGVKINSKPDLAGNLFDIIQEPLTTGDIFNLRFSVENNSGMSVDGFAVDFYLSTNNYISTNDQLLGSYTVDGLAGSSDTGELNTILSLPEFDDSFWQENGTYYVGMIIDRGNAVIENNETNNLNLGKFFDYDDVNITIDFGGI